jgi:methionyl aminopeptidase
LSQGTANAERDSDLQNSVEIKTPAQIEKMRAACKLGREALDAAARAIRPGVTTDEIDDIVHQVAINGGCYI